MRAVAVWSVIFYHLKVFPFSGGYVGVDIFFVISGFLITSILLKSLRETGLIPFNFWIRRIRRLLPAYVFVACSTLLAGYYFLLPGDFESFGRSLAYQSLFISNFLFVKESGYFDAAAELKPLLHTWSLAIEEQFYLILPPTLYLLYRFKQRLLPPVLFLAALASLALCIFTLQHSKTDAFYLPHMRFFELLIGSLAALIQGSFLTRIKRAWIIETIALLALAITLIPFFLYSDATLFPGAAALPPTLGTATLLILNKHHGSTVRSLLSQRFFVFNGKISYSLYLWHWPIIVFYSYFDLPTAAGPKALLVLGILGLTLFTYHLVEKPFRESFLRNRPNSLALGVMLFSFLLGASGWWISHNSGFRTRFDHATLQYSDGASDRSQWWEPSNCEPIFSGANGKAQVCSIGIKNKSGRKRVAFIGNSHMGHLLPAIKTLALRTEIEVLFPSQNCSWISIPGLRGNCEEAASFLMEELRQKRIQHVLIANYWRRLAEQPNFQTNLLRLIRDLKATGASVTLVKQTPDYSFDVPKALALKGAFLGSQEFQKRSNESLDSLIDNAAPHPDGSIEVASHFCHDTSHCLIEKNGRSLYSDSNHLSIQGAHFIEPVLLPYFLRIQGDSNSK
jgi:peptidoglycan/LPS O-acetylase OafA/YrhL